MKMKRFFAADIRQAMRKVRAELGPDAVILSNRRVNGGVEIVSAIDYDEALINASDNTDNDRTSAQSPQMLPASRDNHPVQSLYDSTSFSSPTENFIWDDGEVEIHDDFSLSEEMNPEFYAANRASSDLAQDNRQAQNEMLQEMRREIKTLRGLLENQLSSLAWGDLTRNHPQQAELLQRLMKLGLSATLCRQIAEQIPDEISQNPNIEVLWRRALGVLAHQVPVLDDDILTHGGVVALVGPTGVGKTTTIAKLAARYALRNGSRNVALVTIDNYRIGAHEQLRSYGRLLNIPVRVASDQQELQTILMELGDKRLVLIDTAGMGQRDIRLASQLQMLKHIGEGGESRRIKTYLVLSTATRLSGMNEAASVFQGVAPDGAILTKIDETTSLGSALSVIIQHRLPIAYVSDGQRVPEDLHNARAHTLISRSVAIMQRSARVLEDEALALTVGKVAVHAHI